MVIDMKRVTKEQLKTAIEYVEWLRYDNILQRRDLKLYFKDDDERQEQNEILERQSNAINIIFQILVDMEQKGWWFYDTQN